LFGIVSMFPRRLAGFFDNLMPPTVERRRWRDYNEMVELLDRIGRFLEVVLIALTGMIAGGRGLQTSGREISSQAGQNAARAV
jgi:hypothetical protein